VVRAAPVTGSGGSSAGLTPLPFMALSSQLSHCRLFSVATGWFMPVEHSGVKPVQPPALASDAQLFDLSGVSSSLSRQ
jgi:hypothetical protein